MITLGQDEHVIDEIHRHWFIFFGQAVVFVVFAILPTLLFPFLGYASGILPGNVTYAALFLFSLWVLILWVGIFIAWTTYYLTVLIITNKRIIFVHQFGLFARKISIAPLDRVQDTTGDVEGILSTFLNFGTLEIQTAAEEEEFTISGLPDPSSIKSTISEAQTAARTTTSPAEQMRNVL
ncbi:MAG: PH domain-containing protein [Minisyncoccota bacterium]